MDYLNIIKDRKIIKGKLYRKYFVDSTGANVGIPIGVGFLRRNKKNYVTNENMIKRHPGSYPVSFMYHDALTQEDGIKKTISAIEFLTKHQGLTSPRVKTKKSSKVSNESMLSGVDKTKLPVGITLTYVNKINTIRFDVCRFDNNKKKFVNYSIYCGTPNTWRNNYEATLAKAIKMREESLQLYNGLVSSK